MKNSTSPIAQIRELVLNYVTPAGSVRALDEAALNLRRNETLALVGESGSGKTTLGMAVGRMLPPEALIQSGHIDVEGTDVLAAPAPQLRALRRGKLGFVFQNPMVALDPTMRIGRQVALAIGGKPADGQVAALLARAELPEPERVMRAYPFELSGGMAQRVVIAMAIARNPDILIADEPTASLDASVRERVMQTLGALRRESGASLLLLSHDLRMVARHADRIAVMYGGRVVELGPTAEVMADPKHPYTRDLIAAAAGNERPGERLQPIAGTPPVLRGRAEACSYAPRCRRAIAGLCDARRPEAETRGMRELVCHLGFDAAAPQPLMEAL